MAKLTDDELEEELEEVAMNLITAAALNLNRAMPHARADSEMYAEWRGQVEKVANSLKGLNCFDYNQFVLTCNGKITKYRRGK